MTWPRIIRADEDNESEIYLWIEDFEGWVDDCLNQMWDIDKNNVNLERKNINSSKQYRESLIFFHTQYAIPL